MLVRAIDIGLLAGIFNFQAAQILLQNGFQRQNQSHDVLNSRALFRVLYSNNYDILDHLCSVLIRATYFWTNKGKSALFWRVCRFADGFYRAGNFSFYLHEIRQEGSASLERRYAQYFNRQRYEFLRRRLFLWPEQGSHKKAVYAFNWIHQYQWRNRNQTWH